MIGGRRQDPRREARMQEYGLTFDKPSRDLEFALLNQLDRCKSEEARRIILGKSHKDSKAPKPERFRGKLMIIATK